MVAVVIWAIVPHKDYTVYVATSVGVVESLVKYDKRPTLGGGSAQECKSPAQIVLDSVRHPNHNEV
jgi:hypothetical protein